MSNPSLPTMIAGIREPDRRHERRDGTGQGDVGNGVSDMKLVTTNTGIEKLLTEAETIEALGLGDRPNPGGAIRWLIRVKKLGCVRLGRGILRFRPQDIGDFINRHHEGTPKL